MDEKNKEVKSEENLSLLNTQYNLPEEKESFLDLDKQEIVATKDLTPLQIIQMTAKRMGYEVKDPNKNCGKKGCYGRGYIGWDSATGAPIPCTCLFTKEQVESFKKPLVNREMKREMKKDIRKRFNKLKKTGKLQEELKKIQMETSATNFETSGADNG